MPWLPELPVIWMSKISSFAENPAVLETVKVVPLTAVTVVFVNERFPLGDAEPAEPLPYCASKDVEKKVSISTMPIRVFLDFICRVKVKLRKKFNLFLQKIKQQLG